MYEASSNYSAQLKTFSMIVLDIPLHLHLPLFGRARHSLVKKYGNDRTWLIFVWQCIMQIRASKESSRMYRRKKTMPHMNVRRLY